MDLWGRCDECERWFYMPGEDAACPVCRSAPSQVEDREEGSTASVGMA